MAENTESSGHSRTASHARRQALPIRSTRDPLDSEDPLQQSASSSPSRQTAQSLGVNQPSSTRRASKSPSRSPGPNAQKKNFNYLLRPDVFTTLSQDGFPEPFRTTTSVAASEESLSTALNEGRFHDAAVIAGDLLRSKNDPTDHVGIFALLYVRLACLQISGLHEVAAQESKALQDLNAPVYRDPGSGRHLVPWDLRVLCVRLQSLGFDDWRRGIMAYYDLAREARFQSKHATESQQQWINRLQDISIRIASALVEMEDLSAAARFLESLPSTTDARSSQRLALIWLNIGDVEQARLCIKHGESGSNESQQGILEALCSMADGDLDGAIERFRRLETSAAPESHPIVAQSLGACLVYTSKIKEAKHLLEASTANNTTNTPTIPSDTLFNLSTIYELCSNDASAQKAALAARVAGMEPRLERGMNGTKVWQRGAGEFKL